MQIAKDKVDNITLGGDKMKTLIVMNDRDNIGNALDDIMANDDVNWEAAGQNYSLKAKDKIPFGFKMALKPIQSGEEIIKYGQIIGYASVPISAGECVHIHNVSGGRGRGDLGTERK